MQLNGFNFLSIISQYLKSISAKVDFEKVKQNQIRALLRCVHTKSETIFSLDRIPWKVNVQMLVAAIDALFSRAARLGRRDVADAFPAAQFVKNIYYSLA